MHGWSYNVLYVYLRTTNANDDDDDDDEVGDGPPES